MLPVVSSESQRGSATLANMTTLVAGIGFALLYAGVSQFVAARAATQLAAERAARCIATIEGGCVAEATVEIERQTRWFGTAASPHTEVFARQGFYSITIPHTDWTGRVNRGQLRSERHVRTWPEYELPVTRVVGVLNSFAALEARVQVQLRRKGTNERLACDLQRARAISWGVSFDEPAMYFSKTWCGTDEAVLQEAIAASSCTGRIAAETHELAANPSWGGSHCSLRLPGVSYHDGEILKNNEQPWLLLGGTPSCAGSSLDELPQPIPTAAPSAAAEGPVRPFPIVRERQYLVVDVVSCDSAEAVKERLTRLLPLDSTPEAIAALLGGQRSVSGAGYDPRYFSDFKEAASTSHSLFLTKGGSEQVPIVAAEDWTYLRWERQVEDSPVGPDGAFTPDPRAERTVLTRQLCGWHSWEEAQRLGFAGIENAPAELEPILLTVDDGSCAAQHRRAEDAAYACNNRVSFPPGSADSATCGGWDEEVKRRMARYQAELQRAAEINKRVDAAALIATDQQFAPVALETSWSPEPIDVTWSSALQLEERAIHPDYLRALPPIEVGVRTADRHDGAMQPPNAAQWIARLLEHGVDQDLGWAEFSQNPVIEVAATGRSNVVFSELSPFILPAAGSDFSLSVIGAEETEAFDSDLDCKREAACESSGKQGLEEALWKLVVQQYDEKTYGSELPPQEQVSFNVEQSAGALYHRLGEFDAAALATLRDTLPSCAALQTSCRMKSEQNAAPQLAGVGQMMPQACRSGVLVDCFAVTELPSQGELQPETTLDLQRAKLRALETVRELHAATIEREHCSSAPCLEVHVAESDQRVQVATSFEMPIQFPLSLMLNRDSIRIEAKAEQLHETELTSAR